MTTAAGAITLRPLTPNDRERVDAMTRAVALFRDDEIPVALEVFAAAASRTDTYEGLGAERDRRLVGWICWGPTPCTLGTFDLYWIVVDPDCQGQGIGTSLLGAMERSLARRARLIVVETAGRADYGPTREFYEKHGYSAAARIPDFYAPGDDQVTYTKQLAIDS